MNEKVQLEQEVPTEMSTIESMKLIDRPSIGDPTKMVKSVEVTFATGDKEVLMADELSETGELKWHGYIFKVGDPVSLERDATTKKISHWGHPITWQTLGKYSDRVIR